MEGQGRPYGKDDVRIKIRIGTGSMSPAVIWGKRILGRGRVDKMPQGKNTLGRKREREKCKIKNKTKKKNENCSKVKQLLWSFS